MVGFFMEIVVLLWKVWETLFTFISLTDSMKPLSFVRVSLVAGIS